MSPKTRDSQGHPARETAAAAWQATRRRRLLTFGIPAAGVVVIAVVAAVTSLQGRGGGKPAAPGEVQASVPALPGPLQVGQAVPDFSAPALGGGRVSWRDVRGTPVALVVWASWCPHCQRELPVVARVAPEFPGVRVLTVTTAIGLHPGPSPEEFVRSQHLAFPVAVDDASQTLAQSLGIRSFPTVYWVGGEGRVRALTEGERGEDAVRASFRALAAG